MSVSVFISYSHADDRVLERLHKHLAMLQREGLISTWFDHAILPGSELEKEISDQLDRSDIFVALISADYLDSKYCYEKEFEHALTLYEAGRIRIIPVIVEPCDWLSSDFQKFLALPKDGKPISDWTNTNTAYLDIVNGLRRLSAQAPSRSQHDTRQTSPNTGEISARRVRLKRDFDVIEKAEFADRTFIVIRNYFSSAADELAIASDEIRTRLEDMSPTAFTCTIVNRARREARDAHITVHNKKGRHDIFGDINYTFEPHAPPNTSNGSIRVSADDYDLFLTAGDTFSQRDREGSKLSPEQVAEWLWNQYVERAGIEYE